jgi:hypothetical protein
MYMPVSAATAGDDGGDDGHHHSNKKRKLPDVEEYDGAEEKAPAKAIGNDGAEMVFSPQDIEMLYTTGLLDTLAFELEQYLRVFQEDDQLEKSATVGITTTEYIASLNESVKLACMGDARIRRFQYAIASFKMRPYTPQQQLIQFALTGLIPQFFGDSFEENKPRIVRDYGLGADFRTREIVSYARRRGKSEGMGAVEAASQYAAGGRTAIFAPYFQQAADLMAITRKRLIEIVPERWIVQESAKRIVISESGRINDTTPGAINGIIRCYSGNVNAGRGFTAGRILVDEGNYVHSKLYTKTIFAGLLLRYTFVLIVSSPSTRKTVFAVLCEIRDRSGNLMNKVLVLDTVCALCRAERGKTKCEHVTMPEPPWFDSREEQENLQRIMALLNPAAYRAEMMGLTEDTTIKCFTEKSLSDLFQGRARAPLGRPPKYVIIGLDPSGGSSSDSAVCAVAVDENGITTVCSCSSSSCSLPPLPRPHQESSVNQEARSVPLNTREWDQTRRCK